MEHCSGQKHQDSIAAEMLKRTSIFQEKLDERNLRIAYRNFPSMLKMMRTIGLEKLEHFQHESLWSVRGILTTMGRVIKKITKAANEAKCYGLMVDDVTDIQVKEQNIIFIQYVENANAQIRFLAVKDLMEDAASPNAKTITDNIKEELVKDDLDVQKFLSLASDGASVMVGKNNGVAALLKRENPRLVNVHCICHRLALACGDSNNEVEYMLTIERLLVQLYKWLENSCVKTAAYLKMQLRLRDMQLPADESKRHKIGHKLQRACRTRWLSTDKAVLGVWQDYTAILLTLSADEFRNDATAIGLLSQMKTVKFIGSIYILKMILPILTTISKCFQAGVVSFAKIVPTLQYAKEQLKQIATNETPIAVLKQDLQPEGRLQLVLKDLRARDQPDQSLPTLTENIDARFQESSPVLDSFKIFDLLSVPTKTDDGFSEYGSSMIKKLADHYFPGPQHAEDHQQLIVEWQKAKYDLLQWKENDLPQAIRQGEGSITATDWCLSKLMQPPYRSHYPRLSFMAEVCLSCPVSNAWPERGASVLKWQKNRLRSRIKNDLLNPLLHISINGPKQQ